MLINNRYRVISPLGEGGFGHAYLAEDTQMPSQRRCVIKQLKPVTTSPDVYQVVKERFQREAAILEKLGENHRQIPRLYAYFSEDQQFYLVQEWIEGETLEEIVSTQGVLSEAVVKAILLALLPALDFIHAQGIIHRDLKPDNIMLRAGQAQGPQPVLIDFGAVRETMGTVFNSRQHPTSSIVIGTPGYMASEQAAGRPLPSSDLYSLGLTAIYLLTGRIPQSLESDPQTGEIRWRQVAGQVSPGLVEVLDKAVRSHPRDRYSSASQMLSALSALPGAAPTPSQMPLIPAHQPATHLSAFPVGAAPSSEASTFKTVVAVPAAQAQSSYDASTQAFQTSARSPHSPADPVVSGVNTRSPARFSPWMIGLVAVAIGAATVGGGLLLRQPSDETTVKPTASQPSAADAETENDNAESDTDSLEAQSPDPEASSAPSADPVEPEQPVPPDEGADGGGQQVTLRSSKGGQINVFESPSFAANSPSYGVSGDRVTVLQQTTGDDGDIWYFVRFESGVEGWVSSAYASSGDSGSAPPPATPSSATPPPANSSQSPQLVGGGAGSQIDIYSSPSYSASSPHYGLVGDRVTVLNSAQGDDGRTWLQIQFQSGAVGWVSSDFVQTP